MRLNRQMGLYLILACVSRQLNGNACTEYSRKAISAAGFNLFLNTNHAPIITYRHVISQIVIDNFSSTYRLLQVYAIHCLTDVR